MVKTVFLVLLGAFLLFYIITSPDQASDIVHNVWSWAGDAAHGVGKFFTKLAS